MPEVIRFDAAGTLLNGQHRVEKAMKRVTLDDVRTWPAVVDVPKAASAFGIGRARAYELIQNGQFPAKVLKLGAKRYKVLTASVLAVLSGEEDTH